MRLTGCEGDWEASRSDMSDMVTSSSDAAPCFYGVYSPASSCGSANGWDSHGQQQSSGFTSGSPPLHNAGPLSVGTTASGAPSSKVGGRRGGTSGSHRAGSKTGGAAGKSTYKHVPHRDKPPHLVARRNARERRRVQAVNTAFARLRKCVPSENRSKRLSKVKTLQRAIEYIHGLQDLLSTSDGSPVCVGSSVGVGNVVGLHGTSAVAAAAAMTTAVAAAAAVQAALDGFDEFSVDQVSAVNKENEINQRWITLDTNCSQENYSSFIPFYDDFPSTVH